MGPRADCAGSAVRAATANAQLTHVRRHSSLLLRRFCHIRLKTCRSVLRRRLFSTDGLVDTVKSNRELFLTVADHRLVH